MNNKTRILFYSISIFMVKILVKLGFCLGGLHGTRLSLIRLVVFMDILFLILMLSMLNRTMLLFGVTCVILLSIMLVHVLIMHAVLILIRLYV